MSSNVAAMHEYDSIKIRIGALNAFALNYLIYTLDIANRNGIPANGLFTAVLSGGGAGT